MKASLKVLALLVAPLAMTGCGSEDFTGRYVDQMGVSEYEFLGDGELRVTSMGNVVPASYEYDQDAGEITIQISEGMPKQIMKVSPTGEIKAGLLELTRLPDADFLIVGTWIAETNSNSMAFNFSEDDNGDLRLDAEIANFYRARKTYEIGKFYDTVILEGRKMKMVHERDEVKITAAFGDKLVLKDGGQELVFTRMDRGTKPPIKEAYEKVEN